MDFDFDAEVAGRTATGGSSSGDVGGNNPVTWYKLVTAMLTGPVHMQKFADENNVPITLVSQFVQKAYTPEEVEVFRKEAEAWRS